MPADQSPSQPPPMTATTTVTAVTTFASVPPSELPPSVPKWGDPISSIPAERQEELRRLADQQRAWVASTPAGQRELERSAFKGVKLTGAEVFFLAALSLAGADGDVEQQATRLRVVARDDLTTWFELPSLHLEGASLVTAHLAGANLRAASLVSADLSYAHLENANLHTHLEDADLSHAHLEGANLHASLAGANLRAAHLNAATSLWHATISDAEHGTIRVADVRWQDVNLAVIEQWSEVEMLGDEQEARKLAKEPLANGASRADRKKRHNDLLTAWRHAARANRQLAGVMRDQGMNDEADRFAYRGNICQQRLCWYDRKRGAWAFLALLWLSSGYGYRLQRILVTYALVLAVFTLLYAGVGVLVGTPLSPVDALLISFTAIHGRVFLGQFGLHSLLSWIAGVEAVAGIVVEGIFVAMLIQRFFGR